MSVSNCVSGSGNESNRMLFTLRKVKLCRNSKSWLAIAPGGNEGHLGERELVRIAILTVDCHQAENQNRKREKGREEGRKQHPVLFPASVEGVKAIGAVEAQQIKFWPPKAV